MMSADKDYIGKTMAQRPALVDPGRPTPVGFKPINHSLRLRNGAHLFTLGAAISPQNDQGYMTSTGSAPPSGTGLVWACLPVDPSGWASACSLTTQYGPNKSKSNWCRRFIGTGDGKWLAVFETPKANFIEDLQLKLEGLASIVDQSQAFGIIRLSGPALLATLEKGVQLDLSPDVFTVGRAAVTNIAHIGVNFWKVDDVPTFEIAVARSVAGTFYHWLEASAAIHGLSYTDDRSKRCTSKISKGTGWNAKRSYTLFVLP